MEIASDDLTHDVAAKIERGTRDAQDCSRDCFE
jgi:hypothetical protein